MLVAYKGQEIAEFQYIVKYGNIDSHIMIHSVNVADATHLKWPNSRCSGASWIGGPKK